MLILKNDLVPTSENWNPLQPRRTADRSPFIWFYRIFVRVQAFLKRTTDECGCRGRRFRVSCVPHSAGDQVNGSRIVPTSMRSFTRNHRLCVDVRGGIPSSSSFSLSSSSFRKKKKRYFTLFFVAPTFLCVCVCVGTGRSREPALAPFRFPHCRILNRWLRMWQKPVGRFVSLLGEEMGRKNYLSSQKNPLKLDSPSACLRTSLRSEPE